uniref:Pre-mRNA-splicing factor SLU7 n=1 Tax=Meloidogyne javanica TaxID=6303 RepID=A0A915MZP4_MELJA
MDLKQNCIRMVENKSKKKEDCKFKDLLEDCRGFLSTKKEVKLLSEPVQEPILQKSNIEIDNKNRHYPPKRPYCNHCRKEGHWTSYCYFAEDYQHPKIESKKSYAVKRSDARLYNEGATPKKKKKIWSENSEDKMESCSDGSIKSEGSEDNMEGYSDGSINSEGSNISGR